MAERGSIRIGTGLPGLDQLLGGGLPPEHLYLISGPSGSGKTTLALEFLLEGARRGERSLYIGTAESEAEIQEIAQSHGWDLSGIEIRHRGGPKERPLGPEQTMFHPLEVELPRTMEELMDDVQMVKPERLAIDSLTEIRLLSREPSWFRDQIRILQRHLAGKHSTALLTDIPLPEESLVRSVVHGVIELHENRADYGPSRRRLRIAKVRGISYSSGFHDFAIETGGLKVFPRLVAADHRQRHAAGTVASDLPELDALLGGGIDRGTATLFLGPTGTGKSTVATQYAVAAARRGEKTTMYLFDERVQTLFQRARGLGLELPKYVEGGQIAVRQVDPVELTPGQFTHAVINAVEDGSTMVVIDSLNGYAKAMPEERLLDLHLHELLSYLSQRGITSLQTMTEHGLFTPREPAFDVSYIADTLVQIRPFEFQGNVRMALSVYKRRGGPHERSVRELSFAGGRITVGRPLTQFSGVLSGNLQFFGDGLAPPEGEP